MIPYEEALQIIVEKTSPLDAVTLPIAEALGHVCAEKVNNRVTVSPFDNSAMDGFAIISEQTQSATADTPSELTVAGSTVAGDTPSAGENGAWEIMTGAPVPEGYDAVVKIEDVVITARNEAGHPERISLSAPVPVGNNIRRAGEDFRPGDPFLHVGKRLDSVALMALATVGVDSVRVYPKPRVSVLSTGKEIVDDVAALLKPGQIRNSNGPYLMAALVEMDAEPNYAGVIHDEPEIFEERLQAILSDHDVMISTGAVSAGRHDFIPESLRRLGATIHFHKVAIRPGKPVLYAQFPNGTHYFGLPGNPVSTAVGLRFFVDPLLRRLRGMPRELPMTARLTIPSPKKKGLRFFRKAHVSSVTGGKLQLEILTGQESFKIHPMLHANCWAVLTESQTGNELGIAVAIYPLTAGQWDICDVS